MLQITTRTIDGFYLLIYDVLMNNDETFLSLGLQNKTKK